ncbi:unnamed protein product [Ambrosiozyma monospora]|uniref:Tafazzin family protein n=1 Tax=Ambrosiozyma monospora TaxID=43982 RepID=A0A9W7DFH4_AMBMO|nr:unnamed protein product [Ambrosiozyma monospora]
MSFYDVLQRGDDFLKEYRPARSKLWNYVSHLTCLAAVGGSKLCLTLFYDVQVKGLANLDKGLALARKQNRGFLTIMNHMSVCDDPFLWGCLPWRYFMDLDDIRWGLAASNVCFKTEAASTFFSLGKILSTERFGRGPFQGALDAAVRILSPDDSLDEKHIYQGTPSSKKDITTLASPLGSSLVEHAKSFYNFSDGVQQDLFWNQLLLL